MPLFGHIGACIAPCFLYVQPKFPPWRIIRKIGSGFPNWTMRSPRSGAPDGSTFGSDALKRKKCPTDAQVRRISWEFVGSASLGADRCLLNAAPGWPPIPLCLFLIQAPKGAFLFFRFRFQS